MQQMATSRLEEAQAWPGLEVFDHDGERVGRLTAIYADTTSGEPMFGLVRTGLFGLRSVLVPVTGAFEEGGALILELDKHAIKGAPHLRRDEPLPPEMEQDLYAYYGLDAPDAGAGRPRLALMQLEHAD
jgi:hypothetical protein